MEERIRTQLTNTYTELFTKQQRGAEVAIEDVNEYNSHCRNFLEQTEPHKRFCILNFYWLLWETFKSVPDPNDIKFLEGLKVGFASLEKYALNLIKFPWRREFHNIKLYTGFYKYNVESKLTPARSVLEKMGYTGDVLEISLDEMPNPQDLIPLAFELNLAIAEVDFLTESARLTLDKGYSTKQLLQVREKMRGDLQNVILELGSQPKELRENVIRVVNGAAGYRDDGKQDTRRFDQELLERSAVRQGSLENGRDGDMDTEAKVRKDLEDFDAELNKTTKRAEYDRQKAQRKVEGQSQFHFHGYDDKSDSPESGSVGAWAPTQRDVVYPPRMMARDASSRISTLPHLEDDIDLYGDGPKDTDQDVREGYTRGMDLPEVLSQDYQHHQPVYMNSSAAGLYHYSDYPGVSHSHYQNLMQHPSLERYYTPAPSVYGASEWYPGQQGYPARPSAPPVPSAPVLQPQYMEHGRPAYPMHGLHDSQINPNLPDTLSVQGSGRGQGLDLYSGESPRGYDVPNNQALHVVPDHFSKDNLQYDPATYSSTTGGPSRMTADYSIGSHQLYSHTLTEHQIQQQGNLRYPLNPEHPQALSAHHQALRAEQLRDPATAETTPIGQRANIEQHSSNAQRSETHDFDEISEEEVRAVGGTIPMTRMPLSTSKPTTEPALSGTQYGGVSKQDSDHSSTNKQDTNFQLEGLRVELQSIHPEKKLPALSCNICKKETAFTCTHCTTSYCNTHVKYAVQMTCHERMHGCHEFKNLPQRVDESRAEVKTDERKHASVFKCATCGDKAVCYCCNCNKLSCLKCQDLFKADVCPASSTPHVYYNIPAENVNEENKVKTEDQKPSRSRCEFCKKTSTFICRFCLKNSCDSCKDQAFSKDLCDKTRVLHTFIPLSGMGNGSEKNAENQGKIWVCSRCTLENPAENKICSVCCSTKGEFVQTMEIGGLECTKCTFINKENALICDLCSSPLDKKQSYV